MLNDASPNDWLFPSRKGSNPIGRVQAWRIINKAAEEADVTIPIGTHSLRNTFAYHSYNSCVAITLIMRILNNYSTRETLRYIWIQYEHIDELLVYVCVY